MWCQQGIDHQERKQKAHRSNFKMHRMTKSRCHGQPKMSDISEQDSDGIINLGVMRY
jgi:hypothetical protein